MSNPPKGKNYPFPPRSSAHWNNAPVSFDQAVEMFYDQTATQQYLGHDPVIYSNKYKGVTYGSVMEAQQVHTQQQLEHYRKHEQEKLALEARGVTAIKKTNDLIRNRFNPTEDGLANPLERPVKDLGDPSSIGTLEKILLGSETPTSSVDSQFVNNVYSDSAQSEPLLYSQTNTASDILSDSLALECSLEEEMAKNKQHVMITDLEDAHKILHNIWLERGKDVAALALSINTAKSWFNHTEPMFDAHSIAKQFGDLGVKADLVESKGKIFVAFNGTDKNGKVLKHAFVNGTRLNMNGKKYPLNSFKSMQAGLSPKSRAANFKGAAALTFVVSASIATSDLVFKDDYHLVDWFGNVGADMFKALIQYGAGEAVLLIAVAMTGSILIGGVLCAVAYLAVEMVWGKYDISNQIVTELENAVQN